ncbi:Alpha/Beta hydrolase protein [Bisporella sp. PMI_857]|nr:Alpha/Beta hydrolase protein [Bisporella sp. PMI_857]
MASSNELKLSQHKYITTPEATRLHTVDIWEPEYIQDQARSKIWVIYIHGGAWRDPAVDSKSFGFTVQKIQESVWKDKIAGFASINYRLSSYLSHPTDPSSPDDPSRNAHYPDHVSDIACALLFLEQRYRIASRYVLVGHSAGATMALELGAAELPIPVAVLGVAGIYDFVGLVQRHSHPAYREFMENAFPDKSTWEKAAPYTDDSPDKLFEKAKHVVISSSPQDELVEWEQGISMHERLLTRPISKENVHFVKASGAHDEIWSGGSVLASLIIKVLEFLSPYNHSSKPL